MANSCKDCKHDKGKCVGVSRVGSHRYCFEHKKMTNADRIRAMSDEELAEEISRSSFLDLCDIICGGDCKAVATFNKTSEQRCMEIVLKWLKQPAEVSE